MPRSPELDDPTRATPSGHDPASPSTGDGPTGDGPSGDGPSGDGPSGATPARSLTQDTVSGMFWMAWGSAANAVLRVVVLVVLTRLLTPADFGVVSAALIVVGFSAIFSQLGLGPALVQRPKLAPEHVQTAFAASLCLGLLVAVGVWLAAPAVAAFFHMEGAENLLRALACLFPLRGLSTVAESLLQRELRFRWLANVDVVTYGFGYGVIGIAAAWAGWGAWSLVAAQLSQTVLNTAVLLVISPPRLRPAPTREAFGDLLGFGGGFSIARVANFLSDQGDNLVVGRVLGAEPLGLYTRAFQLMAVPATLFGNVLDRVLFPAMARRQDSLDRLAAAYHQGCAVVGLAMLPVSVVLLALAPEVIVVAFGPRWVAAIVPFEIFAIGMMFRTSYRMSDSLARATGAVYRRAWRQILFAALVIGGAWAGSRWGVPGVAWGVLVGHLLNFLIMAQLSLHLARSNWREFGAAHVPALRLAAVAGGLAWGSVALLREAEAPPAVRLAVAGIVAVVGAAGAVWRYPDFLLGPYGRRTMALLAGCLPGRPVAAAAATGSGR